MPTLSCLPWAWGGGDVSMPPAGSSPLQGIEISHKPLPSASPCCLHFPNPSLGSRATCPPAPLSPALVPGPNPAHCPAWLLGALVPVLGGKQCQQPLGKLGLAPASHLSWGCFSPCNFPGGLCWLPTCQVASPVPGWGCWLCPGLAHPLGCQRGRDTWRHLETRSEHLCTPRGVLCACSPCPAPHSYSLCSASCYCSRCPMPHSPCSTPLSPCLLSMPPPHATPALLPWLGGTGAVGQSQQGLWGQWSGLCVHRGTVEVLWGDSGCGWLCHVCAMGWGSEGQPGAWPGYLGPVWGTGLALEAG